MFPGVMFSEKRRHFGARAGESCEFGAGKLTEATSVSLEVPEKAEDRGVLRDKDVKAGDEDEGEGLIMKVVEAGDIEAEDEDEGESPLCTNIFSFSFLYMSICSKMWSFSKGLAWLKTVPSEPKALFTRGKTNTSRSSPSRVGDEDRSARRNI